MNEKLKIVFMGTPEFAVGILDAIVQHGYDVVGVITAPDKPAGRGQSLKYSAVKEYALANNLKLLQPTNLKNPEFLAELAGLHANLQVVVAFRMLPEVVWRMPKFGTFNLHASLLPQYRGAAPINWAIINGESKTGVTTFFIDDKIDTGAIIHSLETDIQHNESAGDLHDRLQNLGKQAVIDTLQMIENGNVKSKMQRESVELKTAHKLNRENCRIDWSKLPNEIYNLVRGLSPYPAAWTQFRDGDKIWDVRIFEVAPLLEEHSFENGQVVIKDKKMMVAAEGGLIQIVKIQFPGKRAMTPEDLLNGMRFSPAMVAV